MKSEKRIIEVIEYSTEWPNAFRRESRLISEILRSQIVGVHHIGSTSVPGLKAKPIIDILLEVKDVKNLDTYDFQMKALGYTPKGEFGIPGRRFYRKGIATPTHHIHAFDTGSIHVMRHVAFRDYLIAHPSVADDYQELKLRCASECNNDIDKYCAGKNDFIQFHEKKALVKHK